MTAPHDDKPVVLWRVLILRRDGHEILLGTHGTKFALPQIAIPAQQRIAANINRGVERELGLHVISLYEIFLGNHSSLSDVFYHAAISAQPRERTPQGTYWTGVRSLTANSFSYEDDFAAIESFRSGLESSISVRTAEPFFKPNWFREVTSWVENSLRPHSLRLTGPFQQFNASSTFSLIRFETDGTPVWFKAVGAPNTREFPITLALARVCPAYIPTVLASKNEWNAWLAKEAPGNSLSSNADIRLWESAAASLAHLQILTLPAAQEICKAGARNLRPSGLHSFVLPFFEFLAECVRKSQTQDVEAHGNPSFHELSAAIQDTFMALDRLRLPEAVGHMDLNPQNIFCSDRACVFLDWAEAFVGCPFFSFEYLLQHFRHAFSSKSRLEARFRDSYIDPWRDLISSRDLEAAVALSPLAGLFTYAATLRASLTDNSSLSLPQQTYLVRLARKMRLMMAEGKGVRP